MKFLKDFGQNYQIKLLVYGDSGVGKTCFASNFPGPIAFLDFDNKLSSAFNFLEETNPEQIKKIAFQSFSTNRVTDKPYKEFHRVLGELEALVVANKFNYKTVVLDSLTLWAEAMMADVVQNNPGIRRAIQGVPALQDYLIAKMNFQNDIGRLLALPCNVICVGHIKTVQNEATGDSVNQVMLSGQLANYAPKVFREVYRAFAKQSKEGVNRYLQTQPDGKFEVRTELQKMPSLIPMSYEELLKYQPKPKQEGETTNV